MVNRNSEKYVKYNGSCPCIDEIAPSLGGQTVDQRKDTGGILSGPSRHCFNSSKP